MKILLDVDGSPHSEMATKTLKALEPPPQTEVTVMTVVPEHIFLGGITLHMLRGDAAAREQARQAQGQKAAQLLQQPLETLRAGGVKIESLVRWGKPAEEILRQAHQMSADLVVIGAKGVADLPRFPLGSIAQKVMKYADASVLLAREATAEIRRVLLATDGSRHSDAVAHFLLQLPLPCRSQVILVTALQSHTTALLKMPTVDFETNRRILAELKEAEERAARRVTYKLKEQFEEKGYDTESLILRGDPAEEIIMVSRTLNPDLIAVGAKGLTGIQSFLLGSVAQRVARFSRYSVLIGREPRRQCSHQGSR